MREPVYSHPWYCSEFVRFSLSVKPKLNVFAVILPPPCNDFLYSTNSPLLLEADAHTKFMAIFCDVCCATVSPVSSPLKKA